MSLAANLTPDAVWFVTGCSSGLGAAFAKHIFAQGHTIIATARSPTSLSYLPDSPRVLKLPLDVTSTKDIKAAFATAVEKFGRIDVVVNNAGYTIMGDTEGSVDEDARKVMDANFWGVVDVSKEAVRVFREVNPKGRGGTVLQITSMGGWVAFPGNAFYHASKFAVEGFTESFAKEMHPDWNINFLILEPGAMKTSFATSSMASFPPHPAYIDPSMPTRQLEAWFATNFDAQVAEPEDTVDVVFDVVVRQGERKMPLRLPLGGDAWGMIKGKLGEMEHEMAEWKGVIESTMSKELREKVSGWVGETAK